MRQINQPDGSYALLVDETARMEIARQLAEAAAHLDELKNPDQSLASLTETRIDASRSILQLHRIAYQFAGDRAHEIYDESDGSETDLEQQMRKS
ncbi:MAG: hypothetical protein WC710_14675 [Gallionella sp.]|jgi:hypothetical protein